MFNTGYGGQMYQQPYAPGYYGQGQAVMVPPQQAMYGQQGSGQGSCIEGWY